MESLAGSSVRRVDELEIASGDSVESEVYTLQSLEQLIDRWLRSMRHFLADAIKTFETLEK